MKTKFGFILPSLLLSLSSPAFAFKEGGGGNRVAAEFSRIAENAIEDIKRLKPTIHGFAVDGARLEKAFSQAKVFAVTKPILHAGKRFDAYNDPELGQFRIYEKTWPRFTKAVKKQIVAHELLGYAFRNEISDLNYSYSKELASMLRDTGYSHESYCIRNSNEPQSVYILESMDEVGWTYGFKVTGTMPILDGELNDLAETASRIEDSDLNNGAVEFKHDGARFERIGFSTQEKYPYSIRLGANNQMALWTNPLRESREFPSAVWIISQTAFDSSDFKVHAVNGRGFPSGKIHQRFCGSHSQSDD